MPGRTELWYKNLNANDLFSWPTAFLTLKQVFFIAMLLTYDIFHKNPVFFRPTDSFPESPDTFSGPKSNIQIKIQRIEAQVLPNKLVHLICFVN